MNDPYENTTQRQFEEMSKHWNEMKSQILTELKSKPVFWILLYMLILICCEIVWNQI